MHKTIPPRELDRNFALATPPVEIALVVICVLIAEWVILPVFGKNYLAGLLPVITAFVIILLSHRAYGESAHDIGWRVDNIGRALLVLLPGMLAASLPLAAFGLLYGSLSLGRVEAGWPLAWTFIGLFAWGLLQQYALQGFINRRAQMIWGAGTRSVLFVASAFALLHLPNLGLAAATFFGGLLWAWAYQRAPNLLVLGLSHSLMTAVLVLTAPYSWLHGMRVGYGYFL
jgi:membrane protease YdiL (CAAX protease family)